MIDPRAGEKSRLCFYATAFVMHQQIEAAKTKKSSGKVGDLTNLILSSVAGSESYEDFVIGKMLDVAVEAGLVIAVNGRG